MTEEGKKKKKSVNELKKGPKQQTGTSADILTFYIMFLWNNQNGNFSHSRIGIYAKTLTETKF